MSELPKGLFYKEPSEKAPDFVKGKLSVKRLDFLEWLDKQQGEWVNFDILTSKEGKPYIKVDDWKPKTPF